MKAIDMTILWPLSAKEWRNLQAHVQVYTRPIVTARFTYYNSLPSRWTLSAGYEDQFYAKMTS